MHAATCPLGGKWISWLELMTMCSDAPVWDDFPYTPVRLAAPFPRGREKLSQASAACANCTRSTAPCAPPTPRRSPSSPYCPQSEHSHDAILPFCPPGCVGACAVSAPRSSVRVGAVAAGVQPHTPLRALGILSLLLAGPSTDTTAVVVATPRAFNVVVATPRPFNILTLLSGCVGACEVSRPCSSARMGAVAAGVQPCTPRRALGTLTPLSAATSTDTTAVVDTPSTGASAAALGILTLLILVCPRRWATGCKHATRLRPAAVFRLLLLATAFGWLLGPAEAMRGADIDVTARCAQLLSLLGLEVARATVAATFGRAALLACLADSAELPTCVGAVQSASVGAAGQHAVKAATEPASIVPGVAPAAAEQRRKRRRPKDERPPPPPPPPPLRPPPPLGHAHVGVAASTAAAADEVGVPVYPAEVSVCKRPVAVTFFS